MTEHDDQQPAGSTTEADTCPGGALQPWDVGSLPEPPEMNWKKLPTLVGPGILMAGVAIGAGEWLSTSEEDALDAQCDPFNAHIQQAGG